jgi:hypothetical protein
MSDRPPTAAGTTGLASEPGSAALRARIVAGILFAAARFLPVPLVDDLVRERITRWMVRCTIPRSIPDEAVRPLWSETGGCLRGCLAGCLGRVLMLPIELLLFPMRKVLAIVLGVRAVSRDLAEMLLLGRVLDHALAAGLLSEGRPEADLAEQSLRLRLAFDAAIRGTDMRMLRAVFGAALGPIGELLSAATRVLRRFRRSESEEPNVEAEEETVIETSVGRIEQALLRSEIRAFLGEFDRRVQEHLEQLAKRNLTR